MTAERTAFRHLAAETEAAWATRNGGGITTKIPAWDISTTGLKREALPDQSTRDDTGHQPPIIGPMSGSTLGFKTYFSGLETAAANTVTAAQTPIGKLLKSAIGTEVLGTGSKGHSAPGTVSAPVIATTGVISADTIVGLTTATYGVQWRHVETVTTAAQDVLNLSYDLPEAIAQDAVVYATASYKWLDDVPTASSLQLQIGTERADSSREAYGCMVDTLTGEKVGPAQLAALGWGLKVHDWTDAQAVTLGAATPSTGKSPWYNAQLDMVPYGTTAYSAAYKLKVIDFGFAINRGLVADPDPHDAQGVAAWLAGAGPCVTFDITTRITDDWRDAFAAGSTFTMLMATSRTPGKAGIIWAREVVVLEEPTDGDSNGMYTCSFKLGVKANAASTPNLIMAQG